jgi:hypothetical protein
MKTLVKILLFVFGEILYSAIIYVFVQPYLISAKDDILALSGAVLLPVSIIIQIIISIKIWLPEIKSLWEEYSE